jgi:hypothetical protein
MHHRRNGLSTSITAISAACALMWLAGCDVAPAGPATSSTSSGGGAAESPAATPVSRDPATAKGDPVVAKPKLLPGAKTKVLDRAGDRPYDKTFDDIRFDIKPGDPFDREMLPDAIEAMGGERIRIRGFILPTPQQRGIKQFVLVRDNQECCFGPGAALYDCILIEMQPGKTTEYSFRPVAVEGTFDIHEIIGPDKKHLAIYRITADTVK